MRDLAVAVIALCLAVTVSGDVCHYNCFSVDPAAGEAAKLALLRACKVSDYKVSTPASSANNLAAIYNKPAPADCKLAACARFPTQAAVDSFRNDCEHPKPQYQVLNGLGGGRYDAPCSACPTA